MSLLVLGSVRGAPGVTTIALAAAAVAATRGPAWLVEADPAGGVLAARCAGLHGGPGIEQLAYPDRRTEPGLGVASQRLGDVAVVVAPYDPRRARAALARPRVSWTSALRADDGVVVVDAGRLYEGAPSEGLLSAADGVVLVAHTEGVDLIVAAERRERALGEGARAVWLVTAGRGSYPPGRLAGELGEAWLGHVPHDARVVDLLQRGASPAHRRLSRTSFVRAVRDVVARAVPGGAMHEPLGAEP